MILQTLNMSRIAGVTRGDAELGDVIEQMLELCRSTLPRMFNAERREFCFTLGKGNDGLELRGASVRYGAIVLLGAMNLDVFAQRRIFGGETAAEYCERLVQSISRVTNLGDAALIAWSAASLSLPSANLALDHLQLLWNASETRFTVEVAWTLSALTEASLQYETAPFARIVRDVLFSVFSDHGNVFGHYTPARGGLRGHVACFADQVYPIQALARFHHAFDDLASLQIADRAANNICESQGEDGQWWWHYDARTGQVIEGYPVYSVHQNSMAPMCLLDLNEAGGTDFSMAIARGLRWMIHAPEIGGSLIDQSNRVIWRKVGRSDPRKIVRAAQAVHSRLHRSLRGDWLGAIFPARSVDFECRPYHLGWVLHTWLGGLR